MNVALFKGNMKPEEKAASLRSFKVHQQSRGAEISQAMDAAKDCLSLSTHEEAVGS